MIWCWIIQARKLQLKWSNLTGGKVNVALCFFRRNEDILIFFLPSSRTPVLPHDVSFNVSPTTMPTHAKIKNATSLILLFYFRSQWKGNDSKTDGHVQNLFPFISRLETVFHFFFATEKNPIIQNTFSIWNPIYSCGCSRTLIIMTMGHSKWTRTKKNAKICEFPFWFWRLFRLFEDFHISNTCGVFSLIWIDVWIILECV